MKRTASLSPGPTFPLSGAPNLVATSGQHSLAAKVVGWTVENSVVCAHPSPRDGTGPVASTPVWDLYPAFNKEGGPSA